MKLPLGMKRLPSFDIYVEMRDTDAISPNTEQPGTMQNDPDKQDPMGELVAAMKEILSIAQKSLDKQDSGLGDKQPPADQNDQKDSTAMDQTVQRPKSDSPEAMFGQNQ